MRTTRHFAKLANVPSYQRYTVLDAELGSYILTRVVGSIETITIVVPFTEVVEFPTTEVEESFEISSAGSFYSGFAYKNRATSTVLREFNPTAACREAFGEAPAGDNVEPEFESGVSYQNVERLALPPHADIQFIGDTWPTGPDNFESGTDAQTNLVHPCQYSGPVAELTSIVTGLGNLNISTGAERTALLTPDAHAWWITNVATDGFSVQYDFRFDRCHNAFRDGEGLWWLFEASVTNGIIARRLPLLNLTSAAAEGSESERMINKYAGIPSGESFPMNRAEIVQGIADGWIVQMMTPSRYYSEFLEDQNSYSALNCWAFNEDGTEGRTTSYEYVNGWHESNYWKLSINPQNKYATVTKIRNDICANGETDTGGTPALAGGNTGLDTYFYDPTAIQLAHQTVQFPTNPGTPPGTMDAVVWVGRMNGHWSEIKYRAAGVAQWVSKQADTDCLGAPSSGINGAELKAGYANKWHLDRYGYKFARGYSTEYDFGTTQYDQTDYIKAELISGTKLDSFTTMSPNGPLLGGDTHPGGYGVEKYTAFNTVSWVVERENASFTSRFYCLAWNRNVYMYAGVEHQGAAYDRDQVGMPVVVKHKLSYAVTMASSFPDFLAPYPDLVTTSLPAYVLPGDDYPTEVAGDKGIGLSDSDADCLTLGGGNVLDDCTVSPGGHKIYVASTSVIPGYLFQSAVSDWSSAYDDATVCSTNPPLPNYSGVSLPNRHVTTPAGSGVSAKFPDATKMRVIVVGHKVPGEQIELFTSDSYDDIAINIAGTAGRYKGWYQTPVLGEDALIVSDLTTLTGNNPASFDVDIIAYGVHPDLPDTSGNTSLLSRLTFVGINGP
jgi:hypothetical protein